MTQVSASDADVGLNGRVHYELATREREEGSFALDAASGVLRTNKPLDRESVAIYDLKALAIDGGTPPQSSSVSISISLSHSVSVFHLLDVLIHFHSIILPHHHQNNYKNQLEALKSSFFICCFTRSPAGTQVDFSP